MRLQIVLSEQETEDWVTVGEEQDRKRSLTRTIIQNILKGSLFKECYILSSEYSTRPDVLEIVRPAKTVTR
jgi:hypothetical protein